MVWENRTEEDAHFMLVGREKVEGADTPRVPFKGTFYDWKICWVLPLKNSTNSQQCGR